MLQAPPSPSAPTGVGRRPPSVRSALALPLALPLACGACLAAGAAYVAAVDPADGGGLAPCPIRAATGRWCPGCGLTRATHHLLRGDIVQALSYHLAVPIVLFALGVVWWSWLRVAAGSGAPRRLASISARSYALAAVLLAVFTVARNLPDAGWLRGGA